MYIQKSSLPVMFRGPWGMLVMLLSSTCVPGICAATDVEQGNASCPPAGISRQIIASDTLDVLTLNIAHGRGKAMNQMFVTENRHRRNLDEIANLMSRTGAHVIALQEADAESVWSGGFDHVGFLAAATDYDCFVHGHHADTWLFTFGAALMSGYVMSDTGTHAFRPSPPTTTKGFVRGTVSWQNGNDEQAARPITLISIHLDFSRQKVREAQIAELVEALADLSTPVVILGDFNADWTADDSPVREVAREFNLHAFTPTADKLGTYKGAKRLDWILISDELQFLEYAVVPGLVSDHLALFAKIGWAMDY